MRIRIAVIVIIAIMLPSVVVAQDEQVPGSSGAQETPRAELSNSQLTAEVVRLTQQLNQLSGTVTNNATLIQQLKTELGALTDEINNQLATQKEILDAITQPDSQGNHVLSLTSIMEKSPEFRDDVRNVVDKSFERTGGLRIENKMATDQDIIVNQRLYRIPAGAQVRLEGIPAGTVSTQLPGLAIVNWTIGPPNYEQSLSIVPRYTTLRPIAPTTSSFQVQPGFYSPTSQATYLAPWSPVTFSSGW